MRPSHREGEVLFPPKTEASTERTTSHFITILLSVFPATLLYDCPPISILGGIHHQGVLIRNHTNHRFNIVLTTHFTVGIGNNIYLFTLHNHTPY